MKLTKCNQGHFYDADRFETCPHCNSAGQVQSTPDSGTINSRKEYLTEKVDVAKPEVKSTPNSLGSAVEDAQKTVGIFKKKAGKEPVAGWLVCIEGEHYGEDFRIKMGRNFVGRSTSMDIVLSKDSHVSREKHSIIVYEPKGNMFIVQAGESKELSYLNDRVILSPQELNPYDVITLGSSKLLFVPFCSENFKWDDKKED